ncbi:MAG: PLDc N-terminal domain-containing protein [Salinarimonas sp.]|nr:PLDc N-terminal domain-containing protein [Salinarimonas sp.]
MEWLFDLYWPHLTFAAGVVIGLAAALHAAMTKDDVRAAVGWVAVILFSPFLGAFLYLVAGINRIRRESAQRRRRRRNRPRDAHEEAALSGSITVPALGRLGDSISPFRLKPGNCITPLSGGDEAYPAMLEAIRGARRSVALASYIFDHDAAGLAFVEALSEAQARGVEVKVLIDGVGSRYSRPPITHTLGEKGVETALFMSSLSGLRLAYANLRSHRKIMIVDGETAFTGGMNIRAHFLTEAAGDDVAHDTHFKVTGPLVGELMTIFAEDWEFTTNENLKGADWFVHDRAPQPADAPHAAPARAVPSGPDETLESTHAMLIGALGEARERVMLATPYFLPDQQLVAAFGVAARRGVSVDIVIPLANNLKLVDYAMTAQLEQVLRHGCRVWRARGPFDHSKLFTIDGVWSYVGSSNIDPRSLRLNFELDVEVHDPGLAGWIEERLRGRIDDAVPETLDSLAARPAWKRVRNRLVWLASPYL